MELIPLSPFASAGLPCEPAGAKTLNIILARTIKKIVNMITTKQEALAALASATESLSAVAAWLKSQTENIEQPKDKRSDDFDIDSLEFVDLGLPSGLLLATENVKDENGNEAYFTFDEAVKKFGNSLPTKEQWHEVFENCSCKWDDERKGYVLTGPNGNCVFLPAAGFRNGASVNNVGAGGCYWSTSTPYSGRVDFAYGVRFYSVGMAPRDLSYRYLSYRYNRFSVRLARKSS